MTLELCTLLEHPDAVNVLGPLHAQFPKFVLDGDPINRHFWSEIGLYELFPDDQFILRDDQGQVMGCGHTLPLFWDGSDHGLPGGYDAALERGFSGLEKGDKPNTLCALAAITAPDQKGKGVSYEIIRAMKSLAAKKGFSTLIAPVRPTWKQRYPLSSMGRYVKWRRADGAPFDPWLRVHWRMGGTVLRVAPRSMHIKGTVKEWEGWADMSFPDSGQFVVPGALEPVNIDRDQDIGVYDDPNVWIRHEAGSEGDG